MRYISTIFLLVITCAVFAQGRSEKRGLGYGGYNGLDLELLSPGVSWIYNWNHQPNASELNTHESYDMDFIPMAWNGGFNKEGLRNFLTNHPKVKYILGFNEPNFKDQANMTPSQAAAKWPELEAIADEFDLEIVGPAVNYCGNCVSENGTTYTDPVKYLDDFFAACPDCRVDHIAIHCYMNDVNALKWYVGLFKKYEKPIWLTEFAAWEGEVSLTQQKNFMFNAVNYLEGDPAVFRYAWFTGRFEEKPPYIGILVGSQAALTELGEIYVNTPIHDPDVVVAIPGVVQAENYNAMQGINLELTNDESGVINVFDIAASDWLEYKIDVPADDDYKMFARIASVNSGSFDIVEDGTTLGTITFTSTGNYETWKKFSTSLSLSAGEHTLRFKSNGGGYKINWFDFADPNILATEDESVSDLKVFPNPARDQINIEASDRWKQLEVADISGKILYRGAIQRSVNALATGIYLLKFTSRDGKVVIKKIAKL